MSQENEYWKLIAAQILDLLPAYLRSKFIAWLSAPERQSLIPIYEAGAEDHATRQMLVEYFLREHGRETICSLQALADNGDVFAQVTLADR
jgi:hypothetical protein